MTETGGPAPLRGPKVQREGCRLGVREHALGLNCRRTGGGSQGTEAGPGWRRRGRPCGAQQTPERPSESVLSTQDAANAGLDPGLSGSRCSQRGGGRAAVRRETAEAWSPKAAPDTGPRGAALTPPHPPEGAQLGC